MHRGEYIISLDMGTTSTKGMLFRIGEDIVDLSSENYPTHHPSGEIAEQDPEDVLRAALKVVRTLVRKNSIPEGSIACLVFCGILHSLIPVDRNSSPLTRAMIWADTRSSAESHELRRMLDVEEMKRRTGCSIHPLYFPPRLLWLKRHLPDITKRTCKYISIKEYVLHRLYGSTCVDMSTASGTGMWSMQSRDWDPEMLRISGSSSDNFSTLVEPTRLLKGLKREHAKEMGIGEATPGVIGAADGPLAHLGSTGLKSGWMSLTIGTSGALRRTVHEPTMLPGREAWCYYFDEDIWILGAVTHDAGIVMKWFFEQFLKKTLEEGTENLEEALEEGKSFEVINRYAGEAPPGSEGLLFFPFLGGERSPHYNPQVRGAVMGMSFNHEKKHFVRALMEGISYRLFTNYRMLDPGGSMKLVLTGGILKSPQWMQLTADFFGKDLLIPTKGESACWGGVLLGLKALGIVAGYESPANAHWVSGRIAHDPDRHRVYKDVCSAYEKAYSSHFLHP